MSSHFAWKTAVVHCSSAFGGTSDFFAGASESLSKLVAVKYIPFYSRTVEHYCAPNSSDPAALYLDLGDTK